MAPCISPVLRMPEGNLNNVCIKIDMGNIHVHISISYENPYNGQCGMESTLHQYGHIYGTVKF